MLKIFMKQNIKYYLTRRENTGLKHFNDSKAFIEYLNDKDNIYKNQEYKQNKKQNFNRF